MRRRAQGLGLRERYAAECRYLDGLYGSMTTEFAETVALLKAGEPVKVQHGYEIDLHPSVEACVLEPDGSVTVLDDNRAAA